MGKKSFMVIGLLSILLFVSGYIYAEVSVKEQDVDNDGKSEIIMENPFLKVVIDPQLGGRGVSLIRKKTGRDYTNWRKRVVSGVKLGGIFEDVVGHGYPGALAMEEYSYEIISRGPQQADIRLWYEYTDPLMVRIKGLILEKIITLNGASPVLRVRVIFRNPTARAKRFLSYRLHNVIKVGEEIDNNGIYFASTAGGGLKKVNLVRGVQPINTWTKRPGGWQGIIDPQEQDGAIFLVELDKVDKFYSYSAAKHILKDGIGASLEWFYKAFSVDSKGEWKTEYWLILTWGFREYTDITRDYIADLRKKEEKEGCIVFSTTLSGVTRPLREVRVETAVYEAEGQVVKELKQLAFGDVEAGVPVTRSLEWPAAGKGEFILKQAVFESGKKIGEYSKKVTVGMSKIDIGRLKVTRQQRLTTAGGRAPAWSPDGKKIAYVVYKEGRENVWIMDADGKNKAPLTTEGAGSPAWSPDLEKIAYVSERSGRMEIWLRNLLTGEEKQLTAGGLWSSEPDWSPEGRRIVYTSYNEQGSSIWIMDADGTHKRELISGHDVGEPAFSPDGKQIAYVCAKDGTCDIWIMNLETAETRQLTRASKGTDGNRQPCWSPDGKRIAFRFMTVQPLSDIHIIDTDGRNLKELTADRQGNKSPCFSPDGKKIVYSSQRGDGNDNIWVMSLEYE